MATYYVDPSGSNGTGTIGSPFNVLPANFSSAGYINGDIFLFKRGTTYTPAWTGAGGVAFTVNRAILFSDYGSGELPIIGSNFSGTGAGILFRIFTSGCVFENIMFQNIDLCHVLYVQSGIADFVVRFCEFLNVARTTQALVHNALTIGPGGALTGTVTINGNTFDGVGNDAMVVFCSGTIVISNNSIKNVSLDTTNGDNISVSGDCALLRVFGNLCDHTNVDTKQCFIQDGGTVGLAEIFDNEFIGFFGVDSTQHTAVYLTIPGKIYRNKISSWRSVVFCNGPNIEVSDNLILQGGGSASTGAIWGASAGMVANGNTIVRVAGVELSNAAIRNTTSDASNIYKNNCIVGFGNGIRKGAAAVETNNLFSQVGTPVIDAAAAPVTPNASDITADPLLTSDYKPTATSPLLAAGTHLGYRRDIDGKQRQNPPCIGAYDAAPMRAPLA